LLEDYPIVARCLKFDASWNELDAVAVMTGAASASAPRCTDEIFSAGP
jgi:hypothetical protein